MNLFPHVSQLFIYPIKALDSLPLKRVALLKSGALKGDRQFAIFDESGNFVNGKRHQRVHNLRSQVSFEPDTISLWQESEESPDTFSLEPGGEAVETWLSGYFGFPVRLRQNLELGFPDDTVSPGPTIISTATLETIASWYPGLDTGEVRRRFRANIEIAGVPAFWEDCLFQGTAETAEFSIGGVKFVGVNPCQRCIVVSRDSRTGEAYPNFPKIFQERRRETLPDWVEPSRFNHFFRLAVNTRVPVSEAGKEICLGDRVRL